MVNDFLDFLFDFLYFLDFFDERKVVLVDLRSIFLHLKLGKLLCFGVLHFLTVSELLFGLGLIAYDTTLRPGRHKGPIRIDLLLNLNFLDNHLLLDNGLTRHKVLEGMRVFNRKDFRSHERISDS